MVSFLVKFPPPFAQFERRARLRKMLADMDDDEKIERFSERNFPRLLFGLATSLLW